MTNNPSFSRRNIITGATALGILAIATRNKSKAETISDTTNSASSQPGQVSKAEEVSVSKTGNYERVELVKPTIRLSVVQSRVRGVEIDRLEQTRRNNLDRMLELIDAANNWGGSKDLLLFHEFPITIALGLKPRRSRRLARSY